MHTLEQASAFILAVLMHLSPGLSRSADKGVVRAMAVVAADPEMNVTLEELTDETVYAALESLVSAHPRAFSWDARGHVSCGYLQEPCGFVDHASLEEQSRYWLRIYRAAGLAALDSNPKRAARRQRLAAKIVKELKGCPWHAGLMAAWI
jgi:hypothetical protein